MWCELNSWFTRMYIEFVWHSLIHLVSYLYHMKNVEEWYFRMEWIQAANQPSSYVHTFIFIFVYICSQFITRVSVSSHFQSLTDFWWSDIITTSHLIFVTTRKIDKIIMMLMMMMMLGYEDDRNCTKMAKGWFS